MLLKPRSINVDGVEVITALPAIDIAVACRLYELKMSLNQTIDYEPGVHITISLEDYSCLVEARGRYEELKDQDVENESLLAEYKELLVIKGKYEELSAMFDNQQLNLESESHGVAPKVQLCNEEHVPGPDDNGNGCCRGM